MWNHGMASKIITSLAGIFIAGSVVAETINVPAGGDIQAAINSATDFDIIQLEYGIYYPQETIDTLGKAIAIIGVIEPKTDARSVISGKGLIRVLQCVHGESEKTVFENLMITGGTSIYGGGMYNYQSSPTLRNCIFVENFGGTGGGMRNSWGSNPLLIGCLFKSNHAYEGAGIYNTFGCSPKLFGCVFSNNVATTYGAGMSNYEDCNPELEDCAFHKNSAIGQFSDGGGMHNRANSNPILTKCTFQYNAADDCGGGIYNDACDPVIDGCVFEGCTAFYGGGIANALSNPTLTNCIFLENSGHYDGGGIYNDEISIPQILSTTLMNNFAQRGGGMFSDFKSLPYLSYTQLCHNSPDQIYGDWIDNVGNTLADHCQESSLADLNGDGVVNGEDLGLLLMQWGMCSSCSADLNGDGQVGGKDLGLFLVSWGEHS